MVRNIKRVKLSFRLKPIINNWKGCWYDLVGSSEIFMTNRDKFNYLKNYLNSE